MQASSGTVVARPASSLETLWKTVGNNMKSYPVVLLLAFSSVVKGSDWKEKTRELEQRFEQVKMICAAKHELTHEEFKALDSMQIPETAREKCISECFLTESGLMEDGRFSRNGSDALSEFLYDDDDETLQVAKSVSKRCEKELESMKLADGCEMAGATIRCLRKMSKQMGLKQTMDY